MTSLLADQESVPDNVYVAALENAVTAEEAAFRNVLIFHRDVLNGGLEQALWNQRENIEDFVEAYRAIDLAPVASLLALGRGLQPSAQNYEDMLVPELEALTSIYVAIAYNLAYVVAGNRDDPDFPLDGVCDQIERLALRFARMHLESFQAVLQAAENA